MSMAVSYRIGNKGYLIHANVKAVSGFHLATDPFIRIANSETEIDLIPNAIKESLNSDDSKRVPDPSNWNENNKRFLAKTGLKSLNELNKPTTLCCLINKEKDKIIFTPTKHAQKPEKGFLHKGKDQEIEIPVTASNEMIIKTYLLTLEKCE